VVPVIASRGSTIPSANVDIDAHDLALACLGRLTHVVNIGANPIAPRLRSGRFRRFS
jgi:hypothetical protein